MFFRHFLWVTLQLRRSSDSESTDVLTAGRICIYMLAYTEHYCRGTVHTLPVVAIGMHGIALGDRWTSTAQPVCQRRRACKTGHAKLN